VDSRRQVPPTGVMPADPRLGAAGERLGYAPAKAAKMRTRRRARRGRTPAAAVHAAGGEG